MKRIMTFVLSVLLLVGLTACNQGEKPPADGKLNLDKATIEIGTTHTDIEGMEIQIVNAFWNDEEIKLDVNWINKTGYDVVYGDSYDIERENNGEWSSCVALDNLAFNEIGYELKSGVTQKKTYGLTDIFDISQNGKYRIKSHCFVYEKGRGGESTSCELWAEFTVTRVGDLDGVNPKTQPTVVSESGSYSNITLTIPYDWEYKTERGNNSDEYCISFWPADQTEGKIKMWYYTAFGVCGTGLEEEEITVGEYKAHKGTYDNKKVWDFISFADMPGSYVAMNEGADKWWSQYGDEAMQILGSVKIAEGILTEQQAIDLAKKDVTVEYNQTSARFDTEKGLWTVSFSKKNTAGGDQVFTITHEGKIIDVEYGE